MKLLWLDLNSSYAHSSLALPALHAQIANNTDIEWCTVSATINENTGSVVNQIYRHQPDIIAATNWLFNHEQLLHIVSRAKSVTTSLLCYTRRSPRFLGDNEAFLYKNKFVSGVFRGEGEEVISFMVKSVESAKEKNGNQSQDSAIWMNRKNTRTTGSPVS